MSDIKTKEVIKGSIKTLDRNINSIDRMRDIAIKTKRGVLDNEEVSGSSPSSYATENTSQFAKDVGRAAVAKANLTGRSAAEVTKKNLIQARENRRQSVLNSERISDSLNSDKSRRVNAGRRADTNSRSNSKRYDAARQLARSKHANKLGTAGKASKNVIEEGKRGSKNVRTFLKSIREIAARTKSLILGLTAAGWLCVVMIFVTLFIGGTVNAIDVLSVDPNQDGMSDWDKKYIEEILEEYPNAYIGPGDGNIVNVAQSQVGNVGGRRYWYWYGFRHRVAWCCCFVSWCADQCGYIDDGIMPKFAGTGQGVNWFKKHGVWHGRNYRPQAGDIIFFTWTAGEISHVGIVKSCDGKRIYTIEGNSGDRCREKNYAVGSGCIYGIASPKYVVK